MSRKRRETGISHLEPRLSRGVSLVSLFNPPEAPTIKPETISDKSWDVIQQAVAFVHQVEIKTLDDLITDYIAAIVRAEGCGCAGCRKTARILTEKLDSELLRQAETESIDTYEANRAIAIGMQRVKEKRLEEWDKRAERLRVFIEKVVLSKKNGHIGDPLTQAERAEVRQLLKEARARRKKRRK